MKKILLINNRFKGGGAEKVFYNTIKILKTYKPEFKVYTASCDDVPPEIEEYIEEHLKLRASKNNPINYIFNFSNFVRVYKFIFRHKFDIIHLHNFYGDISPSILLAIGVYKRKIEHCKIAQTLHDYSIVCPNSSLFGYQKNKVCEDCIGKRIKYSIILNRCYHGKLTVSLLKFIRTQIALSILRHESVVDKFITPSIFLAKKISEDGISPSKITLIRNPISYKIGIKDGNKKPIILFVGRLSPEKGVDILIKAFVKLKEKKFLSSEWKLYIVGSGTEESKLKSLDTSKYIEFFGEISNRDVLNLMREASLLVLPSLGYENAPNVIMEGIMTNNRILVTNHGGMKEFSELFPGLVYNFEFDEDKDKMGNNLAKRIIDIIESKYDKDNTSLNYDFSDWGAENYISKLVEVYFERQD